MNIPFLVFPKVIKTIDVSLWGNIHEKHEYDVINEAAPPGDEYSALHYYDKGAGKNVMKWLSAEISDEVKNISLTDEIGNMTKSIAIKQKDNIQLNIIPRFSMFGGHKNFWNIQYD